MAIVVFPVAPSFWGLNETGWLGYPNRFICPKCQYGVSFSQESLTAAASYVWDNRPRQSKLGNDLSELFHSVVEGVVKTSRGRFALDFPCPKCSSPYTLAFEQQEFHMAAYRFRPLAVWGLDDGDT